MIPTSNNNQAERCSSETERPRGCLLRSEARGGGTLGQAQGCSRPPHAPRVVQFTAVCRAEQLRLCTRTGEGRRGRTVEEGHVAGGQDWGRSGGSLRVGRRWILWRVTCNSEAYLRKNPLRILTPRAWSPISPTTSRCKYQLYAEVRPPVTGDTGIRRGRRLASH